MAKKAETLGVVSDLALLDHAQELRSCVVWRLYAAILTYFSLADGKEHSLAVLINPETFASGKEYGNMSAVSDEDFEKVMTVLGLLTEKERTVIVLRFGLDRGTPRTLERVGEILNVTRERARQLEARALRKMRAPTRRCKRPALFGFIPPAEPDPEDQSVEIDSDIDDLGLSIRAYNCLKRFANINTIQDILNYPKEEWSNVKNLGRKATLEIQDRMRAVGYSDFSTLS